jgi:hypothetical protein
MRKPVMANRSQNVSEHRSLGEFAMGTFLSVDETQRLLVLQFEGNVDDEVFLSRYQQALEWNAIHRYPSLICALTGTAFVNVTFTLREAWRRRTK